MEDQRLKQDITIKDDANSSVQEFENRRQFVRVFYPISCPEKYIPDLIVNDQNCRILDVSENGIRFNVNNSTIDQDKMVNALLRFPDGATFEIYGEIVRRNNNQVALKLEKGISYCRIMSEMLRLRNLEVDGKIILPYKTKLEDLNQ